MIASLVCATLSGVLRRVENCKLTVHRTLLGGRRVHLQAGRSKSHDLGKHSAREVEEMFRSQQERPVWLLEAEERNYWMFRDRFYWDNDGLTENQVYALLMTRMQREQQRIQRAEAMVARGFEGSGSQRGVIPDDVKQLVWKRDGGRCRNCGSATELQFDHVIPVALGGASSEANLQLLCGPCNRRKGAGLTIS